MNPKKLFYFALLFGLMPAFSAHGMKRKKEIDSNTRPRKRRKIKKKLSDDEYSSHENPLKCKYCLKDYKEENNCQKHQHFLCTKNPDMKNVICLVCNLVLNSKRSFLKHIKICEKIYKKKVLQLEKPSKELYQVVLASENPTNNQQLENLTEGKIMEGEKENEFTCLCCNQFASSRYETMDHIVFRCNKNTEKMNILCDCGGVYPSGSRYSSHRNKYCSEKKGLKLPVGVKRWPREKFNFVHASKYPTTKEKKQKLSISKETAKALQPKTEIPLCLRYKALEKEPPIKPQKTQGNNYHDNCFHPKPITPEKRYSDEEILKFPMPGEDILPEPNAYTSQIFSPDNIKGGIF